MSGPTFPNLDATPVSAESKRAVPYTRRAPSPPFIPVQQRSPNEHEPLTIRPQFHHGDPGFMTEAERSIIMKNINLEVFDGSIGWEYKKRHEAQRVVDWLYLGPRAVIKEQAAWVQSEGITMILVIHESLLSRAMESFAKNTAANTGIETRCVAADSAYQLIHFFPDIVRLINAHLVQVYHHQTATLGLDGASIRPGKVLVTCQTGNALSNVVVAAYIMATYGCSMPDAVNYVGYKRFCCDFNEDAKRALLAWGDIIYAHANVNLANNGFQASASGPGVVAATAAQSRKKRTIHDTGDQEDAEVVVDDFTRNAMDGERFSGREAFKPFLPMDDETARATTAGDQMEFV